MNFLCFWNQDTTYQVRKSGQLSERAKIFQLPAADTPYPLPTEAAGRMKRGRADGLQEKLFDIQYLPLYRVRFMPDLPDDPGELARYRRDCCSAVGDASDCDLLSLSQLPCRLPDQGQKAEALSGVRASAGRFTPGMIDEAAASPERDERPPRNGGYYAIFALISDRRLRAS